MLLAAGLGTRLRPLTDLRPKPIVPVANRPLELVESTLRAACPEAVELRFSREKRLLGTGGGLREAQVLFDDPQSSVIVMNGDTLFGPDLGRAHAEHLSRGAVATMILRRSPEAERFGAIGVDQSGWVRSLLGAPHDDRTHESLMFTGVHILAPEAFSALPESGCVIRSAYRHWVDRGAPVLGVIDESPWADLGTVAEYHRLNLALASGSFTWPGVEPRDGCILPDALEPSANVRRSVIGTEVDIAPGVQLDRCVVWPGTHVTGSATNAVLTPEHRLELS